MYSNVFVEIHTIFDHKFVSEVIERKALRVRFDA